MINETNLEHLKPETLYLADNFYLNTQKPENLSTKIKNKLKKYSKPFGLGITGYLGFEAIKNLSVKTSDLSSTVYSYSTQLFSSWFDSINISLLSSASEPVSYHCSGISGVLGHGCHRYSLNSITEIINIMCYIFASAFIFKSFIIFNEYYKTKGKTPISKPIVYAVLAALLFALPTLFSVSTSTVWSGTPQGSLLNVNA